MATETTYSKKELKAMMERYTLELLRPHAFIDLPVKFKYETSQYGSSVSCHLRTTESVVLKVPELVAWFEKLPEADQTGILESGKPNLHRRR